MKKNKPIPVKSDLNSSGEQGRLGKEQHLSHHV
jgi:hypothetical protein